MSAVGSVAEHPFVVLSAATLVATFALPEGGDLSPAEMIDRIHADFLDFATVKGLTLIPCGWAPDADTILDNTPDADSIEVIDVNPAPNE